MELLQCVVEAAKQTLTLLVFFLDALLVTALQGEPPKELHVAHSLLGPVIG